MKKLNKVIVGLALVVGTAAYAVEPPPVDANVNVTRDRIQQVIAELLSRDSNIGFNVSDYRAWEPKFKTRVTDALTEYEEQVQSKIIPVATLWAKRYQDIAISNQYSANQKEILLKSTNDQAIQIYKDLGLQHEVLVKKLYESIFGNSSFEQNNYTSNIVKINKEQVNLVESRTYSFANRNTKIVSITTMGKQTHKELTNSVLGQPASALGSGLHSIEVEVKYINSGGVHHDLKDEKLWISENELNFPLHYLIAQALIKSGSEHYSNSKFLNIFIKSIDGDRRYSSELPIELTERTKVNQGDLYQNLIYPILTDACSSKICLGLVAGDLAFTLNLIKSTIDVPLAIKYGNFKNSIRTFNNDIKELSEAFSSTVYPKTVNNLSYDTP